MVNRQGKDYNDLGWEIFVGDLNRFINQIDAEITSDVQWHLGPQESFFGRFAPFIKINKGKGGMYFDLSDEFAKTPKKVEIRIDWLDNGLGEWSVFYITEKKADKVFLL